MKSRVYLWLLALCMLTLCAACGHHSNSTPALPAYVRLVNTTLVDDLALSATGTVINTGVAVGAAGSYGTLTAGAYSMVVSSAGGTLAASTAQSVSLGSGAYYTVVAYQRNNTINILTLSDNQSAPSTGFATVTIGNSSTDAGPLDVYFLPHGTTQPLSAYSPISPPVTSNSTSLPVSITAGSYDLVVTAYSKQSDIRLTVPSITLASTEIATLLLSPTVGGALVDGAIVQQQGSVQIYRSTSARIRVVGGLPVTGTNPPSIATTIGSTSIALPSLISPSLGTYVLVTAPAVGYSVAVDGGTPVSTGTIFASGGDYTILVYGTSAVPLVAVLTDNNQAPNSSSAKLRLVNGSVPTAAGGLTLTDNSSVLENNVPFGADTDSSHAAYSSVNTGISAISITAPTIFHAYSSTPNLLSGGVYTLFVLGDPTANPPNVTLSKDR